MSSEEAPADGPRIGETTKERAIWECLNAAPDNECAISVMFAAAYPELAVPTPRAQMQKLGSFVKRLNEKLAPHGRCIKPGLMRRTYRLQDAPTTA